MFLVRAKKRFKDHFFENLKAGKLAEVAADESLTLTKKEMQSILDADSHLEQHERDRIWYSMLEDLIDWQLLLANIPIDVSRLHEIKSTIDGPGISEESRSEMEK